MAAAHRSTVPPKRLAHYNEILREQLAGLDAELQRCLESFRQSVEWTAEERLTPAVVEQQLNAELRELRRIIRELREDLIAFRDPTCLADALSHFALDSEETP